ncbi:MAG: hypothetical protein U9N10_06895, partial [Bacillota bacterium]|nr:hypothetical protein [Bacillota bacterium]
ENIEIKDAWNLVSDYFKEYYIKEFFGASEKGIKENITAIKKFYKYLLSIDLILKKDYNALLRIIKLNKDDWIYALKEYDHQPFEDAYQNLLEMMEDEEVDEEFQDEINNEQNMSKILYEEANVFLKEKPWEYLESADLFVLKFEDVDKIFTCSVMRELGDATGLIVYDDVDGLDGYFRILSNELDYDEEIKDFLIGMSMSFQNRKDIDEISYMRIMDSGVKFRGKKQWPEFIVYEPGFLPEPFFIENLEIFVRILKVVNKFVLYLKDDKVEKGLLEAGKCYLLNVDKDGKYKSEKYEIEEIFNTFHKDVDIRISYNEMDIRRIKKNCKKSASVWEMDSFYSAHYIEEEIEYYPVFFIIVDRESGMIVGQHVLRPLEEDVEIQQYLINLFINHKSYPRKVILKSEKTWFYIEGLFKSLEIEIEFERELRFMPDIKKELSKR